jgi:hypothetical protein
LLGVPEHEAELGLYDHLTAVVEDALRAALARGDRRGAARPPELPTSAGGRLQPGVDLDDSAALIGLMEGERR